MLTRLGALLAFAGAVAILPGQTLPWYLTDQYPAASSTGVPTNTSILLRMDQAVIVSSYSLGLQYRLTAQSGATVRLKNADVYNNDVSVTPESPLEPSTRYTFTITPASTVGDPYSFEFTTGPGPDREPPQLIGFDPPSGTANVGASGPLTVLFNKRLLSTATMRSGAFNLNRDPFVSLSMAPDGKGVIVRPSSDTTWRQFYQLTVDPTKVLDASGNAGQGPPQSAQYTTFAATDPNGPTLTAFFPADGDTGLPLNVAVRLLFSQRMSVDMTAPGVTIVGANGTPVAVRTNSFAGGYGIELKPQSMLAANQVYRVQVGSGLRGQTGAPARSASFQFTTGTDPDLTPAEAIAVGPDYASTLPANVLIALRTNKRIMPLSAVQYSTVGSPSYSLDGVAGKAFISADGQVFRFTPQSGIGRSGYRVDLQDVVDVTGALFTTSTLTVTPGPVVDEEAPRVLAINPPDGSITAGTAMTISAWFDDELSLPMSGDFARLSSGGNRVPAKLTVKGRLVTLQPEAPLTPNTYQLEFVGATDLAGNVMPAASSTFTIDGEFASRWLNLVSSSPADGDQEVDVNSSISFSFDAPLSPVSAFSGFSVRDAAFREYPATATVSGSTITIRPVHPLLGDSTVQASANVSDISGRTASANTRFRTGRSTAGSRFRVTSVSHPDGAVIATAGHNITLTLSNPVNPASYAAGGITVYSGGAAVPTGIARSNNDLSLVITPSNTLAEVTLVLDSRVTDVAGNVLEPFRATYTLAPFADPISGPALLEMRPPAGSSGVPANTGITWFLSQPVDLAVVRANLVVTADGQPVPGTFILSADGQTLTFRGDAPFPAGSSVSLFQRTPILSTYSSTFAIAPAPSAVLRPLRHTPEESPVNAVIEVEFSKEVGAGQGLVTLNRQGYPTPGPAIPAQESSPRPRVLRLTPAAPLAPGNYQIVVSPKVGGGVFRLKATAEVTPRPVSLLVGPAADATQAPTNTYVKAAVRGTLNPLSVNADTVTLEAEGRIIPVLVYLSNAGIKATPTEALPPNTVVRASITGLEDRYGNPIPGKSWTFTTAAGPDFSKASVVETNAPISCTWTPCPPIELPANTSLVYRFDRPMDPHITTSEAIHFSLLNVEVTLTEDLRTLTVTPVPAFSKGSEYSVSWHSIFDLAGNEIASAPDGRFFAAFDSDSTPPRLLALSPADGMSAMPLNTSIMARFDESVLWNSARNVQLLQGDTPVPLAIFQDDLQHIRLAPKSPLLSHTTYTVVFAGITDLAGNAMEGAVRRSFTTGDILDVTPLIGIVYAGSYTNIPLRTIFNKPVSPATVDAHTMLFQKAAVASGSPWIPLAASYEFSSDGRTVTVLPRDPLIPGWPYRLQVQNVRDFAGNAVTSTSGNSPEATFSGGYGPDTKPPVATVTPSDGTSNAPVNTNLAVTFDSVIPLQDPSSIFQLFRDGRRVPGAATVTTQQVTFRPDLPLEPGVTYRIDIASVTDLAGNTLAPFSTRFTTAAGPYTTQFQLASSTPANGDAGVALDAPLVLRFTRPVDPSTLRGLIFRSSFPISGSFSASGESVTFTPSGGWPPAATIQVGNSSVYRITDLLGYYLNRQVQLEFRTAAAADTTPPQLLSISPEPGTLLTPPTATLRLTFSKMVALGSGLLVFSGNDPQTLRYSSYDTLDPRTLLVTVEVPSNSQITLVGNEQIKDRAGNSLAPFSFQYPTAVGFPAGRPEVSSVTPYIGSADVPPQTPIVLRFNKPMVPETLTNSIRVTQDGETITGRLDLSDSNQSAQFTPDKPYKEGSRIDVFVLEAAADTNGATLYQRYSSFFMVAGARPSSAAVDQLSFGPEVSPDAWLELAFDRPLDPATVTGETVWLRSGRHLVAGEATLRAPHIIRFTPRAPMEEGAEYVLTAGSSLRAADGAAVRGEEFRFLVKQEDAAEIAAVEAAMQPDGGAVLVRFTGAVDPLSLDGVRLLGPDGAEIPASRQVALDHLQVKLRPHNRRLDPGSLSIQVDGVRTRGGRAVRTGRHRAAGAAR